MGEVGLAVQDFINHGMIRKLLSVVEGQGVQLVSICNEPGHDCHRDFFRRPIGSLGDDRKATASLDHGNEN
ncbi:hypothetical protein N9F36_06570 [Akkermansiaceae bacterium]|nr:hypothetical protein [Akkermansiaceae bacterium]